MLAKNEGEYPALNVRNLQLFKGNVQRFKGFRFNVLKRDFPIVRIALDIRQYAVYHIHAFASR